MNSITSESVHASHCPMTSALDVIGGKWKGFILYLLRDQTLRFNQLQRQIPLITPRMLTRQLRELEADGIVARDVYPQIPPKVEYSLTPLGQTVLPVIEALTQWGQHYHQQRGISCP